MDRPAQGSNLKRGNPGIPAWKRALDLALIAVCAPGLLLIGGAVALVVKLGSPGPLLFRQKRVGHHGREFNCLKFRTMQANAETDSHRRHTRELIQSQTPMVKLDGRRDPRLVPLGWILRSGGLDELPQLLNVLRGEMSLVGPRPCLPYEYEMYEPQQRRRFEAVPGLTGLWQVSGKNRTTFQQMIDLDIHYAEHCSLGMDLKILLRTPAVLCGQYGDVRATRRAEPATRGGVLWRKPFELFRL